MSETLNVALVGYGFAGRTFHAPLLRSTAGLRLHTIVSSQGAALQDQVPDVLVRAEAADAFADPAVDLVVIATPNEQHAPLAHQALEGGKHVVIDKPMAVSVEEARAVLAHAREAGRLVSVFHNRRWDADFLTVRALKAQGRLGEIAEFHSHFDRYRPHVRGRWREQPGAGAGLWLDLGAHLVDQTLQLLGRPLAVWADLAAQRGGGSVDDYFHVVLRYPSCRAILHGGSLVSDSGLRFAVHGHDASFVKLGLDPQEDALRRGETPLEAGWGVDPRPGMLTRVVDGQPSQEAIAGLPGHYRAYYEGVRDAVRTGNPPPVTGEEALDVMSILERARQSSLERREVLLG